MVITKYWYPQGAKSFRNFGNLTLDLTSVLQSTDRFEPKYVKPPTISIVLLPTYTAETSPSLTAPIARPLVLGMLTHTCTHARTHAHTHGTHTRTHILFFGWL